eukprot:5501339-Prymnesium_polylepis.1
MNCEPAGSVSADSRHGSSTHDGLHPRSANLVARFHPTCPPHFNSCWVRRLEPHTTYVPTVAGK